jgi:hypothetical protein
MNRLFTCGDTHGSKSDTSKISSRSWPEQKELTKDDVLFQLGDFGWVWYPLFSDKEQEYNLDLLADRKYTLAVIPGNHENYDEIFNLPIEEKWGGKVRVLYRNATRPPLLKDETLTKNRFNPGVIYFLERGEVYTINDKKIFVFGGALSTDKANRNVGIDWWEQEVATYAETDYAIGNLEKHNWKVDYILSHTCPASIIGEFIHSTSYTADKFKDPTAIFFDHVYKNISFSEWHFGHLHSDLRLNFGLDGIFHCHYLNPPTELS